MSACASDMWVSLSLALSRWGLFCFVHVLCVAVGISKCTETILFVAHLSHSSFRYVTNYVISNTLIFNVLKIPKKRVIPGKLEVTAVNYYLMVLWLFPP